MKIERDRETERERERERERPLYIPDLPVKPVLTKQVQNKKIERGGISRKELPNLPGRGID